MKKTCLVCGAEYRTEDKRRKYCGRECYRLKASREPNAGAFNPGAKPWNKDLKGIHLSPASEFKPGVNRNNPPLPLGTVRIRRDKNNAPRAFVKIAQPNTWRPRHILAWEAAHGPVPRGMVIHHRDHDSLNDDPGNLALLTRAQHIAEHRMDLRPPMFGSGT